MYKHKLIRIIVEAMQSLTPPKLMPTLFIYFQTNQITVEKLPSWLHPVPQALVPQGNALLIKTAPQAGEQIVYHITAWRKQRLGIIQRWFWRRWSWCTLPFCRATTGRVATVTSIARSMQTGGAFLGGNWAMWVGSIVLRKHPVTTRGSTTVSYMHYWL